MNILEFQKKLKNDFEWINKDVFDKIEIYKNYLRSENKKFNLTRLHSDEKIYSDYFYESIFVYKNLIENKSQKILDIGSGSGIPGIIIGLIFDRSNITIIEPNLKKCKFMKTLIEILSIRNIIIINNRAECLDKSFRENFDIATSRAVASLKILLEITIPYLKINGILIQPKSSNLDFELKASELIIKKLNIFHETTIDKKFNEKIHKIIIFKKIKPTNLIYPRKWREIINE